MTGEPWAQYGQKSRPLSSGRIFLAEALEALCLDRWFLEPADIAKVFQEAPDDETAKRRLEVRASMIELGCLFQKGAIPTFARPFGGGLPEPLPPTWWEIDDFEPRFSTCAMNLPTWFDGAAKPTHWILVDGPIFDAWLWEYSSDAFLRRPDPWPATANVKPENGTLECAVPTSAEVIKPDRAPVFLRLDEVLVRTGMRRSSLYDRMQAGTFPRQRRKVGERAVFWLEADVIKWQRSQIGDD